MREFIKEERRMLENVRTQAEVVDTFLQETQRKLKECGSKLLFWKN